MRSRAVGSMLLALVLGLSLTACADSARHKRIDNPARPNSVSTRIGSLHLQHIRIQHPDGKHATGGDAGLFLTIDNRGTEADTLVAVSSVDAQATILRSSSL